MLPRTTLGLAQLVYSGHPSGVKSNRPDNGEAEVAGLIERVVTGCRVGDVVV